MKSRQLSTSRGTVRLPAFLPVTTFGGKFPIDDVIRPYLGRYADCLMVSHFYAQHMKRIPDLPIFMDSGGFASLFEESEIVERQSGTCIRTKEGDLIDPVSVLEFQHRNAEIGATLDFLVPPQMSEAECLHRQELTIRNAIWAVAQPQPRDFQLYASVQAWDGPSAERILRVLQPHPFAGFALGGMVPRISNPETILRVVAAIRSVERTRPLHVFGVGQPTLVRRLFDNGVNSVDSSNFVRYGVQKKYLDPQMGVYCNLGEIGDLANICDCRACRTFDKSYFALEGELNNLAVVLHNLAATIEYLGVNHEQPPTDLHRDQQEADRRPPKGTTVEERGGQPVER